MYRVITASSNTEDLEKYLQDIGLEYDTPQSIQNAIKRFDKASQDAEERGEDIADVLDEFSWDEDYDPEVGAEITVICNHLGIDPSQVVHFRANADGDFLAVTLKDGTVKYFFDRGVAYSGLKDAETGEIISL